MGKGRGNERREEKKGDLLLKDTRHTTLAHTGRLNRTNFKFRFIKSVNDHM